VLKNNSSNSHVTESQSARLNTAQALRAGKHPQCKCDVVGVTPGLEVMLVLPFPLVAPADDPLNRANASLHLAGGSHNFASNFFSLFSTHLAVPSTDPKATTLIRVMLVLPSPLVTPADDPLNRANASSVLTYIFCQLQNKKHNCVE